MKVINVAERFSKFSDHWSPKIVGELNGQHVKLAKLKGEFVWHAHEHEDELFLVVRGELRIELETELLTLHEGELVIIPRGVRHRPIAQEEVQVMLFEPKSTVSTGEVSDPRTTQGEWL